MSTITTISFDEWFNKFKPNIQPDDPIKGMYETYGPDLEYIQNSQPDKIWTLVDCEDGNLEIHSGYHYVNRLGYFVTLFPFTEETHVPYNNEENSD